MAGRHLVFVYGTLMRGEHHHDQLAGAEFMGARSTRAQYELVQVDYFPAMLRGGHTSVVGELYAVDDAILARLDELEEVPHYYVREGIELSDDTRADTYLMPRERAGDSRSHPFRVLSGSSGPAACGHSALGEACSNGIRPAAIVTVNALLRRQRQQRQ